jgi:hypothetical protein
MELFLWILACVCTLVLGVGDLLYMLYLSFMGDDDE